MKRTRLFIIVIGIILTSAFNAYACGPDFDEAYFVRMSPEKFSAIPEGHFLFELRRISGLKEEYRLPTESVKHVVDADINDLRKALSDKKISEKDIALAVASYQHARQVIADFLTANPVEDQTWYGGRFRSYERVNGKIKEPKIELWYYNNPILPIEKSKMLKMKNGLKQ